MELRQPFRSGIYSLHFHLFALLAFTQKQTKCHFLFFFVPSGWLLRDNRQTECGMKGNGEGNEAQEPSPRLHCRPSQK